MTLWQVLLADYLTGKNMPVDELCQACWAFNMFRNIRTEKAQA